MRTQFERRFDLSGGLQVATNMFLRASNEVDDIINGNPAEEIGGVARRNGYQKASEPLVSEKAGLGLHNPRFSTGEKLLAAINNSGDTATLIKSFDGSDWSDLSLPDTINPNTRMQMLNALDETYIAGIDDTGERMKILNVQNDLTVSDERNLIGAPEAALIAELGGNLYAINVKIGDNVYANRAYRSSQALSAITFSRGNQASLIDMEMKVDTVRFLKAGMRIDVWNHVDEEFRYEDIEIESVNKAEDTITLPAPSGSLTFTNSNVNTSNNRITLSSTTNYQTGQTVVLTGTNTLPTPLVADTPYYVIRISGTAIQLATSLRNAENGENINITNAGSGTNTAHRTYYFGDNDEIYLTGRKGELYYLWNTDYPTEDKADYIQVPSGIASNADIIGWGESNDRLFLFTESSMHKWDRGRLTTRFKDIGLANHETIQSIGDWMMWMDSEGRVHAYNDATGQHERISRAIEKKYRKHLAGANFAVAAAGKEDNIYKLSLGEVNGEYMRICYDFDSNNWWREKHSRPMLQHTRARLTGQLRLYFLDNQGNFYLDNEGDTDDGDSIPMLIRIGRNNLGTDKKKEFIGFYVFSENMSSGQLRAFTDGKPDGKDIGTIEDNISNLVVGKKQISGRDIDLEFSINVTGDTPILQGYVTYFSTVEDNFG